MPNTVTKLPSNSESPAHAPESKSAWHPLESRRKEINRAFDEFNCGS